jgi:uncharacterized protein YihD (DUF1040 family)
VLYKDLTDHIIIASDIKLAGSLHVEVIGKLKKDRV